MMAEYDQWKTMVGTGKRHDWTVGENPNSFAYNVRSICQYRSCFRNILPWNVQEVEMSLLYGTEKLNKERQNSIYGAS